jgi:hypothetical protein
MHFTILVKTVFMFYHRSDLLFDYQWQTQDDDPKLRGEPDSSLFNRHQGWEVLYLINKFGSRHKLEMKSVGNKIERMIHDHLPADVRSQEKVSRWLQDHWSQY